MDYLRFAVANDQIMRQVRTDENNVLRPTTHQTHLLSNGYCDDVDPFGQRIPPDDRAEVIADGFAIAHVSGMDENIQAVVLAVIERAPQWIRHDLSSKDANVRARGEEGLAAMIASALDGTTSQAID